MADESLLIELEENIEAARSKIASFPESEDPDIRNRIERAKLWVESISMRAAAIRRKHFPTQVN